MGGRSWDSTSSQPMYRALDTVPFLASGMLLWGGGKWIKFKFIIDNDR